MPSRRSSRSRSPLTAPSTLRSPTDRARRIVLTVSFALGPLSRHAEAAYGITTKAQRGEAAAVACCTLSTAPCFVGRCARMPHVVAPSLSALSGRTRRDVGMRRVAVCAVYATRHVVRWCGVRHASRRARAGVAVVLGLRQALAVAAVHQRHLHAPAACAVLPCGSARSARSGYTVPVASDLHPSASMGARGRGRGVVRCWLTEAPWADGMGWDGMGWDGRLYSVTCGARHTTCNMA